MPFFAAAVEMLMAGKILAVKGLGGFHLVHDANNADAVAELRRRKRRDGKAFAVMAPTVAAVRALCFVGEEEEAVPGRRAHRLRKRPDGAIGAGWPTGFPSWVSWFPTRRCSICHARFRGGLGGGAS